MKYTKQSSNTSKPSSAVRLTCQGVLVALLLVTGVGTRVYDAKAEETPKISIQEESVGKGLEEGEAVVKETKEGDSEEVDLPETGTPKDENGSDKKQEDSEQRESIKVNVTDEDSTVEKDDVKLTGINSLEEVKNVLKNATSTRVTPEELTTREGGASSFIGMSGLTNRVIDIIVGGEDASNVETIEMVDSPRVGRNYATNKGYDELDWVFTSSAYDLYDYGYLKGKELTVSFEVRTGVEGKEARVNALLYGGNSYEIEKTVTDEYQRFQVTVPKGTPNEFSAYSYIELKRGNTAVPLVVKNVKVELGGTATPYTKAPENVKYEKNDNLFSNEEWLKTTPEQKSKTSGVPYINIQLEPNTEYTLSTDMKRQDGVEGYYDVFFMNSSEEASSFVNGVGADKPRTVKTLGDGVVKVAMRGYDSTLREETRYIKLNKGTYALPNKSKVKTYPVTANGGYTFKVTYKDGSSKETKVNVNNFISIRGVPYRWTDANVTLTLDASGGETSKVTRIQLPNKVWVNGDKADYRVTDNGTYTFIAEDKEGNKLTENVWIDKIDKVKPTITSSHKPTTWTSKAVDIEVLAYDEESGVEKLEMTGRPSDSKGGGENLFLNSNFMFGKNNWENRELTGVFEVKDETLSASGYGRFYYSIVSMPIGEYYTVSFDARKDGKPAKVYPHQSDAGLIEPDGVVVGNEWKRYTQTLKIKNTNTISFVLGDKASIYQFRNMKLEKGKEATPWIPSVGDGTGSGSTVFPVATNGKYTFTATDYAGNKADVIHEVTNIDSTPPEIVLTKDVKGYTNGSSIKLTYTVKDTQSGLKSITLPDGKVLTNQSTGTITVTDNGEYDFIVEDNVGNSMTYTEKVTQFDREAPNVTVKGNPKDWSGEDEITLTINAEDSKSGVQSIQLPDNKIVYGNTASYKVNANGKYTFIATDNLGNKTTHTEVVDKLMLPYIFYIYDANSRPIKGAGFALLRDGKEYTTADSDEKGLVDFGKVPPTGKYTIKQIKAPEGHVIDPTEKEVEVGDTTEPDEFISYPRGEILPATGTSGSTLYLVAIGLTLVGIGLTIVKKRKQLIK